jgi:hypothetical protein
MREFGFMLKTFIGDASYVERLVKSFNEYNTQDLRLYIVAPSTDFKFFNEFLSKNIFFVSDEDIPVRYINQENFRKELTDPRENRSAFGYLNQGISKLGFWRTGLLRNYLTLDSDTEFIRPFAFNDFSDSNGNLYFFGQQYLDLACDPFYRPRYWDSREEILSKVRDLIGLDSQNRITVHNSQIMSSLVLADFEQNFLKLKNLDYVDIMQIASLEFFWYGVWMQKQEIFPMVLREDVIKMVNHQGEHLALHQLGIRKKDLATSYIGVIVNSNWSRQYGLVDFDNPPIEDYKLKGDWAKWLAVERQR